MRFVLIAIYLILIMPITGSWWAEGSNILLDPAQVCEGNTHRNNRKAKRLTGKLAEICKNDTSLMREIKRGINLGFRECENQFRNNMWNCSWTIKRSMRRILTKDTRETAFVHAITAAGITYAVTKACTMGDLVECSCQNHVKKSVQQYVNGNAQPLPVSALTTSTATGVGPKGPRRTPAKNGRKMNARNTMLITSYANYNNLPPPAATMSSGGGNRKDVLKSLQKNQQKPSKTGGNGQDGSWEWGGCDDNVNFGFRKSKDFLDARLRKKSDIRTLVKLHNNNAGRLAVKQFMRMECKCHGLSGSCTMRTCWMKMPPFSEVATRLKEHFDGATKVIARNDGHSFMPDDPSIKLPTKRDLVYTEDSDDFCEVNAKTGSLGTHGRECNITSNGVDGCNLMCCERGQARKHVEVKRNCKCSFKWCCEVTCSTCIDIKEVYTCK
ncbi:protein Wnt-6 [Culex quinquefasciatus]|uniref:protein Wnt-6 n=1 Tax=Culex quinquefasciatus TaxID=7176 RepID=UPI0018E35D89|nr:protein Wnt-6 [Culex quinquefasciatus]